MAVEPKAVKALAALDAEATLAGAILPGSDLHTLTSARLVGALREKHGQKDRRTQAAISDCLEVRGSVLLVVVMVGQQQSQHCMQSKPYAMNPPACMQPCPMQPMPCKPHAQPPQAHKLRYGPLELRIMRPLVEASIAWASRLADSDTDVGAAAPKISQQLEGVIESRREAARMKQLTRQEREQEEVAAAAAAAAQQEEQQRQQPERKRRGRPRKTAVATEAATDQPAKGKPAPKLATVAGQEQAAAAAAAAAESPARLEEQLQARQRWQDPNPLKPPKRARRRSSINTPGSEEEGEEEDEVAQLLAANAYEIRDLTPEEIEAQQQAAMVAARKQQVRRQQQQKERRATEAAAKAKAAAAGSESGGDDEAGGEHEGSSGGKGGILLSGASLPLLSRWMAGGTTAGSAAASDGLLPEHLSAAVARQPGAMGDETAWAAAAAAAGELGEGGLADGIAAPAEPSGRLPERELAAAATATGSATGSAAKQKGLSNQQPASQQRPKEAESSSTTPGRFAGLGDWRQRKGGGGGKKSAAVAVEQQQPGKPASS